MDMSFENQGLFAPEDTGVGLRPMTWHNLCARIAAVQDLRRVMAFAGTGDAAISKSSFHSQTASLIASGYSGGPAQQPKSEGPVNPNSSVNGKDDAANLTEQTTGKRASRADLRD